MPTYDLAAYGSARYPPDAGHIRSFEGLFHEYATLWPEVIADAHADRWPDSQDYASHLLRLARRVASEFPTVELWDHLEENLRHSLEGYDPARGTFDRLFERNLRERLRRSEARESIARRRRREAETEYAVARSGRAGPDESVVSFYRWASLLLERAHGRLDYRTRVFLLMRRSGVAVADIAACLGVTEQCLKNQYGGQKLRKKVRRVVHQLVLDLPDWHRLLLVRHLLDEVELRPDQVHALLGVTAAPEGVPVLPEPWLLKVLGWTEKKNENSWECSATGPDVREYVFERHLRLEPSIGEDSASSA